jgi:hypothetical protein
MTIRCSHAKSSVARVMISTLAFDRTPHAFRADSDTLFAIELKMRSPSWFASIPISSHYKWHLDKYW